MKKLSLLSGFLLLSILAAFAFLATRHRFKSPGEDGKPITFSPSTLELGEVWDGTILEKTVRVFNSSSNSIVVHDIKTDCSCTTARLGSFQLPARSSMEMNLQFDPITWHGPRATIIQLVTDRGTFVLNATAIARKTLEIVPTELNLGSLTAGQELQTNIVVHHNGPNPFKPSLSILPPGVKAELTPVNDNDWSILFSFSHEAFKSIGKETFQVAVKNALTNSPQYVALRISAQRERNTVMHPDLINFGFLTNSLQSSKTVVISNRNMGAKFAIVETSPSQSSIKVVQKNVSAGCYTLEFSVTPAGLEDRHTFEQFVTFVTNDPQDSTPQIRLIGSIVDPTRRASCCGN